MSESESYVKPIPIEELQKGWTQEEREMYQKLDRLYLDDRKGQENLAEARWIKRQRAKKVRKIGEMHHADPDAI